MRAGIAAASLALVASGASGVAQAGPSAPPDSVGSQAERAASGGTGIAEHAKEAFDSRTQGAGKKVLRQRASMLQAKPPAAVKKLRAGLGTQGVVALDPLTGTPRNVARLDGFLTGASTLAPSTVALRYVAANQGVFGLSARDLRGLKLRKAYVDIAGTHHLSYVQTVGGVPVFGNGLKANVARDGRLISVQGSPVRGLASARVGTPRISADAARRAAAADVTVTPRAATASKPQGAVRKTTFSGGDVAQLVVFQTLSGPRLAWQTIGYPNGRELFLHVVDASTGQVLYRDSLTDRDTGLVWDNRPGAARGGKQVLRDLTAPGWLPAGSPRLAGNVAHVYSDVNDDNRANAGEEIPPRRGALSFRYPFRPVNAPQAWCSVAYPCSWNPSVANSWKLNRAQDGVQLFYFLGKFHDHLRAAPIGFTRSAGNFEAVDDDAVQGENIDGANTANGLPDPNHVDNANMSTPPDGMAPRMQMYLFHQPGATQAQDPFVATSSSNEAAIVYHEYTHGLSNRLVVDANGVSTLSGAQAGAMGEAWSDFYAFDFLAAQGMYVDTAVHGELLVGEYVAHGQKLIRTSPMDCPVGSWSARCPGTVGAGRGGYTYGDFGHIIGSPQVHADGEIWGQTLWDLRRALGSKLTQSLVTRAMELSPSNPSFLDERNAILQADTVVNRGRARAAIWRIFANRGMGFFAGALDGDDTEPVEDFTLPPAPGTPRGTLTGKVLNSDSGAPVAGALVAFGGHASGFAGDYAALTNASGIYKITGIFPGTYPKVFAVGPGYDRQVRTVSVSSRVNTVNWSVRRDWASVHGGGAITAFTGPDFTPFGCGPVHAIDQSLGSGWVTTTGLVAGAPTPKHIVIRLPVAVNVSQIAIDPAPGCGLAGSASTKDYTLETSPDGTTWTVASDSTFGPEHRGKLNPVDLASGSTAAVRYLRYTIESPQLPGNPATLCPGPYSGCTYMGTAEVAVYGTQAP